MRGGEIFEVSLPSNSHSLLIEGHSQNEQHALDVNPQNHDEFVTAGDDGILRIWSISKKSCIRKMVLDFASRAICWSPNGKYIIIGIGGVTSMASKDGSL
jgi:microtubule-associated protein-like 6